MMLAIIGFGTQGKKRYKLLKKDKKKIFIVDPIYRKADAKNIKDLKTNYSHALVCTPDDIKYDIILFLIQNNKKILVEKPLYLTLNSHYKKINFLLKKYKESFLYVAYNHRFEPNIIEIKKIIDKKLLGKIYYIDMYYGNGTVALWKNSTWRTSDKRGVIMDLAPHLLDLYLFIFGDFPKKSKLNFKKNFETDCLDIASFSFEKEHVVNFTVSLLDWKNKFSLNIIGSKGKIRMKGLCKWSRSELIYEKRVLPSGIPLEKKICKKKGDPTWDFEHKYFLSNRKKVNNISNDLKIKNLIDYIL